METLEFAKYYDITEFAKEHNFYDEFEKIFICSDVWDFWIARVTKDMYFDEHKGEYKDDEGSYLIERNKIPKESKGQTIGSTEELAKVIEEDDLSNWDMKNAHSMDEVIEILDGGYGIETLELSEI